MTFNEKEYMIQYYLRNREKLLGRSKQHYLNNKDRKKQYDKHYCIENKDKKRQQSKQYRLENKEKKKQVDNLYHLRNREKHLIQMKQYQREHKTEMKEYKREYDKSRKKNDKNYWLMRILRTRTYQALERYSTLGKIKKSDKYGIDYKAIIKHLAPFPENKSEHADHIIPVAAFNFDNPEEIRMAFCPENYQWMPGPENFSKNDILIIDGKEIRGRTIRHLPLSEKIEMFKKISLEGNHTALHDRLSNLGMQITIH